MSEQTKIAIFSGIIIGIIITVGVIAVINREEIFPTENQEQEEASEQIVEDPNALPTVDGGTRERIQEIIETPEPGSTAEEDIAIPRYAAPAGKKGESALRTFDIKVESNAFIPSTIVVDEKDLVKLEITAQDADYDIFFPDLGVFKELPQGKLVKLQIQAYPFGKYQFFCKNACDEEVKGTLIANEIEVGETDTVLE